MNIKYVIFFTMAAVAPSTSLLSTPQKLTPEQIIAQKQEEINDLSGKASDFFCKMQAIGLSLIPHPTERLSCAQKAIIEANPDFQEAKKTYKNNQVLLAQKHEELEYLRRKHAYLSKPAQPASPLVSHILGFVQSQSSALQPSGPEYLQLVDARQAALENLARSTKQALRILSVYCDRMMQATAEETEERAMGLAFIEHAEQNVFAQHEASKAQIYADYLASLSKLTRP